MRILTIGATGAIGESLSKELADRQHEIYGVGRKQDVLERLKQEGSLVGYKVVDVKTDQDLESLSDYIAENSIETIVYSQGVIDSKPLEQTDRDRIRGTIDVNLTSTILLDSELLKRNLPIKKIVYISSISAFYSWKSGAVYQAGKSGLMAYIQGMRLQDNASQRAIERLAIYPDTISTSKGMSSELEGFPKIPVETLVRECADIVEGKHDGRDFLFIINEDDSISFEEMPMNKETNRPIFYNSNKIKELGKAVR